MLNVLRLLAVATIWTSLLHQQRHEKLKADYSKQRKALLPKIFVKRSCS